MAKRLEHLPQLRGHASNHIFRNNMTLNLGKLSDILRLSPKKGVVMIIRGLLLSNNGVWMSSHCTSRFNLELDTASSSGADCRNKLILINDLLSSNVRPEQVFNLPQAVVFLFNVVLLVLLDDCLLGVGIH